MACVDASCQKEEPVTHHPTDVKEAKGSTCPGETDPKPEAEAAVRGIVSVAKRRAAALWPGAPGTATQHADGAELRTSRIFIVRFLIVIVVVPVATPLRDVPVHVVQPEPVRLVRPHFAGSLEVAFAEVRLGRRENFTEVIGCLRTGPTTTSIFPLRLRRQAV